LRKSLGRVVANTAGIIRGAVGQGVEIRGRFVEPPDGVGHLNEVVTVVTRLLVAVTDVCVVAVHAHLGLACAEGLMLLALLPVSVAASGRRALAPVLAEVAVEADIPRPAGRLRRVVAHAARIVGGVVGQGVEISRGLVEPSVGVRYGDRDVTVVAERFVPEAVVDLVTGHADDFLR